MASICLSADPVQAIQMKFATKEDAIFFAEKQGLYKINEPVFALYYGCLSLLIMYLNFQLSGWDYYVQESPKEKFVKKMYADNYKYSPGKLRIIKTK